MKPNLPERDHREKGPCKYYAIFNGRQRGIYTNWGKAQENVDKFPHTSFRSYKKLDLAIHHMKDVGIANPHFYGESPTKLPIGIKSIKIREEEHILVNASSQMIDQSSPSLSSNLNDHSNTDDSETLCADTTLQNTDSTNCMDDEISMRFQTHSTPLNNSHSVLERSSDSSINENT